MAEGTGLAPAGGMVIAWAPVCVSSWGTLVRGSSDCLGPGSDRLQTDLNGPRGVYFGCEACSQQILGAVQSLGSSRPLTKDLFLVFWERNTRFLFLFFPLELPVHAAVSQETVKPAGCQQPAWVTASQPPASLTLRFQLTASLPFSLPPFFPPSLLV